MSNPNMIAFVARCAVSICCFGGATILLLKGNDHGWGWLMLAGFLACPSFGSSE